MEEGSRGSPGWSGVIDRSGPGAAKMWGAGVQGMDVQCYQKKPLGGGPRLLFVVVSINKVF